MVSLTTHQWIEGSCQNKINTQLAQSGCHKAESGEPHNTHGQLRLPVTPSRVDFLTQAAVTHNSLDMPAVCRRPLPFDYTKQGLAQTAAHSYSNPQLGSACQYVPQVLQRWRCTERSLIRTTVFGMCLSGDIPATHSTRLLACHMSSTHTHDQNCPKTWLQLHSVTNHRVRLMR